MSCAARLAGLFVLVAAARPAAAQANLKVYQTRYYELHTDVDEDAVREATLRIILMAEEYHARTRGLAGTVNQRLPFFLFKNRRGAA